jgi:hypothetical protein
MLQRKGFAVLRGVVPRAVCERLRAQSMNELRRSQNPFNLAYHFDRLFGPMPIKAKDRRHVLKVPIGEDITSAIQAIARRCAQGADTSKGQETALMPGELAGMHDRSIVELNYTVSLPGCKEQIMHTDIRPSEPLDLHTLWVALQDVTLEMGPTIIWEGSHNGQEAAVLETVLETAADETVVWQYSADGEPEVYVGNAAVGWDEGQARAEDSMATATTTVVEQMDAITSSHTRHDMVMEQGDVVVMDAKVFHCGAANRSDTERALLNVTLQSWAGTAEAAEQEQHTGPPEVIAGFTYHIHPDVKAAHHRLRDFAPGAGC